MINNSPKQTQPILQKNLRDVGLTNKFIGRTNHTTTR